jgi:predicted DNA repair protein MutK
MAATGLLMLIDDITTLLDDVALMAKTAARQSTGMADDVVTMTKVATQKTAGVLGDDLALNAEQVSGVHSDRELAVVWAVAKGSLLNKVMLVPAALLISVFLPAAITPLLMVGGAFLCFEGVEKILHSWQRRQAKRQAQATVPAPAPAAAARPAAVAPTAEKLEQDLQALEKTKVSGAIRTDFILSAEIIAIALGTVSSEPLIEQAAVLSLVALLVTVVVYGIVALIVRLDDVGLALMARSSAALQALGRGILQATPWLMRTLSIVGTAAMFLVGGSLLVHGMAFIEHGLEAALAVVASWPAAGLWAFVLPQLVHVLVGALIGCVVLAAVNLYQRLRGGPAKAAATH